MSLTIAEMETIAWCSREVLPTITSMDITPFCAYFNQALMENDYGLLDTHLDDPWHDGLSLRYGAKSVMGTICEVLTVCALERRGAQAISVVNDKQKQVEGHDLLVTLPRELHVSVKRASGDDNFVRLGSDYFPVKTGVDVLSLVKLSNMQVYLLSYDDAHDVYRSLNKTTFDDGNRVGYAPVHMLPYMDYFRGEQQCL